MGAQFNRNVSGSRTPDRPSLDRALLELLLRNALRVFKKIFDFCDFQGIPHTLVRAQEIYRVPVSLQANVGAHQRAYAGRIDVRDTRKIERQAGRRPTADHLLQLIQSRDCQGTGEFQHSPAVLKSEVFDGKGFVAHKLAILATGFHLSMGRREF